MNMARPYFIDSEFFEWNDEGTTIRERMNGQGLKEELPLVLRKEVKDI
jgi:hypothetical protein